MVKETIQDPEEGRDSQVLISTLDLAMVILVMALKVDRINFTIITTLPQIDKVNISLLLI